MTSEDQEKNNDMPLSAVITVPDPDNLSVSNRAEQGGTIQWRTESHRYPKFEIRFQGPNPFNTDKDLVIEGSDINPAILRINTIGVYSYTVRHIKKDGTCKDTGTLKFVIHCLGCPP